MKHMLVELPICASLVVVVVVIVWLLVPPGLPQHLLLAVLVETARLGAATVADRIGNQ